MAEFIGVIASKLFYPPYPYPNYYNYDNNIKKLYTYPLLSGKIANRVSNVQVIKRETKGLANNFNFNNLSGFYPMSNNVLGASKVVIESLNFSPSQGKNLTVYTIRRLITSAVMMSLIGRMDSEVTTLAYCWKIIRRDGEILAFTNFDKNLTIDGLEYEAATGFTPTVVSDSCNMSVDNLDIEGYITSDKLSPDDLLNGLYDGAQIEVFLIDWAEPVFKFTLRKGTLGEIKVGSKHFSTEIRGLLQGFQQNYSHLYQKSCRAVFGDKKCKINANKYSYADTVLPSLDGSFSAVLLTNIDAPDGAYNYGLLEILEGANSGMSIEIRNNVGKNLYLFLDLPYPIEPQGVKAKVTVGCDGSFDSCRTKFNNSINFRGEPHLPGNDFVLHFEHKQSESSTSRGGKGGM